MSKELKRTPEVRMVTVDGVEYQLIDGRLYRYADVTLDKGFKIVFGRVGSEEVLPQKSRFLFFVSIGGSG